VPRDIPIIFSAPMVQALLAGRKTMTRRLLYTERKARNGVVPASASMMSVERDGRQVALWPPLGDSPDYYFTLSGWQNVKPGDRLWVRENFSGEHCWENIPLGGWGWDTMRRPAKLWYWADGNPTDGDWTKPRPSIHMPRWASRRTRP